MSKQAQRRSAVYAKALYELIQKDAPSLLQSSLAQAQALSALLAEHPLLGRLLRDPRSALAAKLETLLKLLPALAEHALLFEGIRRLLERKRFDELVLLGDAMNQHWRESSAVADFEVTLARQPSPEDLASLTASLRAISAGEVSLVVKIDENILAGSIVKSKDYILDNSLKRKLAELRSLF